jgi:hypothetical protein
VSRHKLAISAIATSLILGIVGCPLFQSKEKRYLRSAKNEATEQEVRHNLGEPTGVIPNQNQGTVWLYEIREYVEGGNNSWTMTGSWWCDEYRLTFDEQRILRDWTHRSRRC